MKRFERERLGFFLCFLCSFLFFFCCGLVTVSAQTQTATQTQTVTVKQLEKQRKEALADIETTNKLLLETAKTEKNSLNRLTLITKKIDNRRKLIETMNSEIAAVDRHIAVLSRELARLQNDLAVKRSAYVKSLRTYQLRHSTYDKFLFILSANSAPQAFRRMRYLREYASWQKQQAVVITEQQREVSRKQEELRRMRANQVSALDEREKESHSLMAEEQTRKQEVKALSRRKTNLQAQLSRKQQQAQALNRQIERLIAEEIARAEAARKAAVAADKPASEQRNVETRGGYAMTATEQQLSSDFAAHQGRLPAPLDGTYTLLRGFGEQQHQDFKYVRTNNSGIDLQALPGANACAVFAGEVSRIFAVPGYNTSVILRHGNYLTVYSNLSQVHVKTGDHVTARQIIGRIFTDPESGNETVLHFQIRKERDKLNPLQWIAR